MVKYGIAALIEWLEKNGYEVNMHSNTSEIDPKTKVVSINNCGTQLQTMYTLAHEAGHLALYKNKNYSTEYYSIKHAENIDARHGKSRLYRYKKLKEEIDAWEAGYKLMKRLQIKVNKNAYDLYASKWVNGYIKYLANSKGPTL